VTLHARDRFKIPEETVRVARAAFPKGNVYMTMRDELGFWYKDSDFASLFTSSQGRPAESPGRLALVTVMQYAEGLVDRQAADAVRSRIDWKYALGLELTDPGFDFSVLSEFRDRVIAGGAENQLLDDMLKRFRELGLLKARGRQRTDSSHVLAAIRKLNRLECMGETLRAALNALATVAPQWLLEQITIYPKRRLSGKAWQRPSGPTVTSCCRPSMLTVHRDGCGKCLRLRFCARFGFSNIMCKTVR
jgi:transposase